MPDDTRLQTLAHYQPSMLTDINRFEFGQRVATLFANSQLVPQQLRGKPADCFIALHMAEKMGEDPIMVMQNIYFVSGKAGWSAQYMVARANRSGKFRGPLRWSTEGAGDDLAVKCYADLVDVEPPDDPHVEVTISLAQAKADGWTRNEKYKSMPEHMLRWRSATWLVRLYAPEVMMGLPTADELSDQADMIDVTPGRTPREPRPRIEDVDKPRTRRSAPVTEVEADTGAAQQNSPADNPGSENERRSHAETDVAATSEPAEGTLNSDQVTETSAGDTTVADDGGAFEIITADGEVIEAGSVEELRDKWNDQFEQPMSPDQIIGMWNDNPDVRRLIYEALGSAAMDRSHARFKQAEQEKRQSQPGLLPGLGSVPGAPSDADITLAIDEGWGVKRVQSEFRKVLTQIENLAPELRKTTIERFRQINGAVEIKLNQKDRTWMEQNVHPVYARFGVRI